MEKKTYSTPKVSEIGSINESVHASRLSLVADGAGDPVAMVLLTKSDV